MCPDNRVVENRLDERYGNAYSGICKGQPRKPYIPRSRIQGANGENVKHTKVCLPLLSTIGTSDKSGEYHLRRLRLRYGRRIRWYDMTIEAWKNGTLFLGTKTKNAIFIQYDENLDAWFVTVNSKQVVWGSWQGVLDYIKQYL